MQDKKIKNEDIINEKEISNLYNNIKQLIVQSRNRVY